MATSHYNLPTITGTDTIDGVNAINGLANAVDTAIYGVAASVPQGYTLPIANASTLGGVRGGGDVLVNSGNGDMTLAAGCVGNSQLATNAVGTANIQNTSISAAKLTSDVSTQLSAGYQASQTINGPHIKVAMTSSTGNLYGALFVNPATHLAVMKINAQGFTMNVTASNTSSTNPNATFSAIPVQYRPTSFFAELLAVESITGTGVINVFAGIRTDGVACVYYTNWSAGTASSQAVYGDCELIWYYGDESS